MPNEPITAPPPPQTWSAITPGDLGFKAGFWVDDSKTEIEFRDVIGWVTVTMREENGVTNGFHPVVLNPSVQFPALAPLLPLYVGGFLKHTTAAQARELSRKWLDSGAPPQSSGLLN